MPEFYLGRWARDGEVTQFSQPVPGKFDVRSKPRRSIGFEMDGYAIPGVPPKEAQTIETELFSPIDNEAARILNEIEANRWIRGWCVDDRTHWARFITTMSTRGPEDVAAMKAGIAEEWLISDPSSEEKYARIAHAFEHQTFKEFLRETPKEQIEAVAMRVFRRVNDNKTVMAAYAKLKWNFLDMRDADRDLLTSDRPVLLTSHLEDPKLVLTMPLGPRVLFIGTSTMERHKQFIDRSPSLMVRESNRGCVQRALRFVYGVDDSERAYVEKNFGTRRAESQFTALQRMVKELRKQGRLPSQQG